MPCEASFASILPVHPGTLTPPPATVCDDSSCPPCEKTAGMNTRATRTRERMKVRRIGLDSPNFVFTAHHNVKRSEVNQHCSTEVSTNSHLPPPRDRSMLILF